MSWFNIFKRRPAPQAVPRISGRAFAAAEVSRLLGAWRWDGGFSNQEIASSLATIRARSREMAKNNGDFVKFVTLFKTNVVGPFGFRFKSEAVKSVLDPAMDAQASFDLEYHFARWCRRKQWCDVTGRKNFASICRLAAEYWARDGECFVWLDRNAQNRYGISLRIIRPDACPEWMQGATPEGNWIRNGVEVEPETFRVVAYYFDGRAEDNTVPVLHEGRTHHVMRVPASEVVHLFCQHDETQTRGIPMAHAALRVGKMLEQYNEAELVAAREEANTLGVFHAPLGRESEIAALNDDDDAVGKLTQNSRPGQKIVLPEGWDYKTDTPQHPNREVTAFKATMKRDLANALNVEYANFANDWGGVNFSSVRAGTLSERDCWMTLQEDFVDQLCTPVFEAWLGSFLRLAVSGAYGVYDFDRLSEHHFKGRRWAWVDPMKDVNASVIAVEHNWKTNAQISSEYGCDYDDNLEQAAYEAEQRRKYGLVEAGETVDSHQEENDGSEEAEEAGDGSDQES